MYLGSGRVSFFHATSQIENPDQRICDDIDSLVAGGASPLELFITTGNKMVSSLSLVGVLWDLSPMLVYLCMGLAACTTLLVFCVSGPLNRISYNTSMREGNLRYGLARMRGFVEQIALYDGGMAEEAKSAHRLVRLVQIIHSHIKVSLILTCSKCVFDNIGFLLPCAVLAPRLQSGDIGFGDIHQAISCMKSINEIFSEMMSKWSDVQMARATTLRLYRLQQACKSTGGGRGGGTDGFKGQRQRDAHVAFSSVDGGNINSVCSPGLVPSLRPDTHRALLCVTGLDVHAAGIFNEGEPLAPPLIKQLCMALGPGQRLLIMGASGTGKSSLIRSIAGLATPPTVGCVGGGGGPGQSAVHLDADRAFFLPQRCYRRGGTLLQEVSYPSVVDLSAEEAAGTLERVGLGRLSSALGEYAEGFSQAEEQQLAFARLIAYFELHPAQGRGRGASEGAGGVAPLLVQEEALSKERRLAFLDEATSALDADTERRLYELLKSCVDSCVSVGGCSLLAYHTHVLAISGGGGEGAWQLTSTAEFGAVRSD